MPIEKLSPRKIVSGAIKARRSIRKATRILPGQIKPVVSPKPNSIEHNLFQDPRHALKCWPNKQMQWWYFTGQLKSKSGRRFGYELVFFDRRTHADYIGVVPSRLIKDQMLASHFAITDIDRKNFYYSYIGGLLVPTEGLISMDHFFVQISNWSAKQNPDGRIQLHAVHENNSLALDLTPEKPLAYHQYDGFSPRGENAHHSSFYCSYTRLKTQGHIRVNGELFELEGYSWMDHEKMTMNPDVLVHGWNWYSLQFDTGHDLMVYLLKDKEGEFDDKWSFGSLIDPDGTVHHLAAHEIEILKLGSWQSRKSKGVYPVETWVRIPKFDLSVTVTPFVSDCEIDATRNCFLTYWEGPVLASGKMGNLKATGTGYLEMVGYDRRPSTKLLQFLVVPDPHHEGK